MCRVDYCDTDWTELSDEHRKARKHHECGDCGRTIQPGERYRHVVGVHTMGMTVVKQCAHCEAAAQWLVQVCRGYVWNGVGEELQEHWTEEPDFRCRSLAHLCAAQRRRWEGVTVKKVETLTRHASRFALRQIKMASEGADK